MSIYLYIYVCVFRPRTPQLYFVKCLEIFGGFSIWRERERKSNQHDSSTSTKCGLDWGWGTIFQDSIKTYKHSNKYCIHFGQFVCPNPWAQRCPPLILKGTMDRAAMPHAWHRSREGPLSMSVAWQWNHTAKQWRLHKSGVYDDSMCILK